MPRVSEVYSGNYITAAELDGKGRVPAVIGKAEVEPVGQDRVEKVVLSLTSRAGAAWPRRLVLNKTNSLILASAYGDDTDAWADKQVEVWAEFTHFQSRMVKGIRLAPAVAPAIAMPPPAKPQAPPSNGGGSPLPPAQHSTQGDPDLSDEIPFHPCVQ